MPAGWKRRMSITSVRTMGSFIARLGRSTTACWMSCKRIQSASSPLPISNSWPCGIRIRMKKRNRNSKIWYTAVRLTSSRVAGCHRTRLLPTTRIWFWICKSAMSSSRGSSVSGRASAGCSMNLGTPLPTQPSTPISALMPWLLAGSRKH